jgi:hypothetical protein
MVLIAMENIEVITKMIDMIEITLKNKAKIC